MNKHCKGCSHHHSAGHKNTSNRVLLKFNDWCCVKGDKASKSIGWCKTHNKKEPTNEQ